MNFASVPFLFIFLPVVVGVFYAIHGQRAADLRAWWLLAASLFFYAYSGIANTTVLALSLTVNFIVGRLLIAWPLSMTAKRKALVAVAVLSNVGALASFKILASASGAEGSGAFLSGATILIPLGLSFITFQKIAFVLDCYHGKIKKISVREYLLFIAFFPQLLMGPIVHYRQFEPQISSGSLALRSSQNLCFGLGIFAFGLFKKLGVADSLAPLVDRIFAAAGSGSDIRAFDAWVGAIAFQLQLYMDFSGYADMAIGLARMFNINLPINFDDPFRAIHRFDLWRRWHITFVEFMRVHVFRPLARIRWLPMPAALAITGMLSGFWHGFGWTFVLWGIVQTVLLLGSHYWNRWRRSERAAWLPEIRWVRIAITFFTTASIGVLFRAPSFDAAAHMYAGLVSLQQIPIQLMHLLTGVKGDTLALKEFTSALDAVALLVAAVLVWLLPQTSKLFAASWTAIDPRPANNRPAVGVDAIRIRFRLSPSWGVSVAFMLVVSLTFLGYARRFVYVQF